MGEVLYDPGEALQVDWGECHRLKIGNTSRRVSVLVAVLCYSRLCYIEFSLAEKKEDFYRSIVNALKFFGGSPRKIIFDNLKAAVISGSGKHACFHPEFLELCGHFYLQPIASARRDPESKGMVETNVRYVKQNALAGRDDELTRWEDYGHLAEYWRDQVDKSGPIILDAATYSNLNKLDQQGVQFITLRRRGPKLIEELDAQPRSVWRRIELQEVSRIYRTPRILDQRVTLMGYANPIRQIAVKDLGYEQPTLLLTNQMRRSALPFLPR